MYTTSSLVRISASGRRTPCTIHSVGIHRPKPVCLSHLTPKRFQVGLPYLLYYPPRTPETHGRNVPGNAWESCLNISIFIINKYMFSIQEIGIKCDSHRYQKINVNCSVQQHKIIRVLVCGTLKIMSAKKMIVSRVQV